MTDLKSLKSAYGRARRAYEQAKKTGSWFGSGALLFGRGED
jgi:hypothetical protein